MAGLIIGEPQGLPLHLPCFLECRLVVHLLAAPQVDISDLPTFSPGGHPIEIALSPFLGALALLHLPEIDVFQPGSSLEVLPRGEGSRSRGFPLFHLELIMKSI